MTLSLRRVPLVAAGCLLILLAACSSQSDEGLIASTPAPNTPVATAQPAQLTPPAQPTPTVTEERTPSPTPAPTAPAVADEPATVQLWFAMRGTGGQGPTAPVAVERQIVFDSGSTVAQRLTTIVDLWIKGPTGAEDVSGLLNYDYRFRHCEQPFAVEATETAAVVTLCIRDQPADSSLLVDSLKQTLATTGLVKEAAVLNAEGQCLGVGDDRVQPDDGDPLWCLPAEYRLTGAYRCPFGRATTTALVTGAQEWVNTRLAPSLDAAVAERIPADSRVTVYPSTLTYDGTDHWWITVQVLGKGRCASIAAHLLTGTFGNLADVMPGVSYELPTTGSWKFAERESVFDYTDWYLEGTVSTVVSLRVYDGNRIDQHLNRQLEIFEQLDYDYPENWYDEVDVDGADRAVRPVLIISESGDVGSNLVLIEVGDFTIRAETAVYINDVAPFAEMEAFLQSISIDPTTFLDTLTVPNSERMTLFGADYLLVPEVSNGQYTEAAACGTRYDYYQLTESGERRFAGRLLSTNPTELADRYLLWDIYCEGGSAVRFALGQVDESGTITTLGTVAATDLGMRAQVGVYQVEDDGSITFEGRNLNGDTFVDTFELSDLLGQLETS